jgi:hypothetical protein
MQLQWKQVPRNKYCSGGDHQLPADPVGFHVGVRLDDLVEPVDVADGFDGRRGRDALQEVLEQSRGSSATSPP